MVPTPAERLTSTSALVARVRDIVDERAIDRAPPSWCDARGWTSFLANLSDESVRMVERDGLARAIGAIDRAPDDLRALAHDVAEETAVAQSEAHRTVPLVGASPRKQRQVAELAALLATRDREPSRIIDVGAGHGHLTRQLAATSRAPVIGWERDPARVRVATARAGSDGPAFVVGDVEELAHTIRPGDLIVGLHACGALGDLAVAAAARAGADVALVGCCLQKRVGAREPFCDVNGVPRDKLVLGRDVLGLANARDGDEGVEEDLETRSRSRLQRLVLASLLVSRGEVVAPGEEMRGVNRRQATRPLAQLVERAFATRGLAPPSSADVARGVDEATVTHERRRRWELPRTMMARLLEVWVARDRAGWLALHGQRSDVRQIFEVRESPRNLAVLGSARDGAR